MSDLPPAVSNDPITDARAAGYSWDEIDDHIGNSSAAAVAQGYSQDEINQHLGYQYPSTLQNRSRRTWADAMTADTGFLSGLSNPQPQVSLASPTLPADYAQALMNREVKGPQDFAEHYAASALDAAHNILGLDDSDPAVVRARQIAGVQAADQLAQTLPSSRDVTDAALSVGGAVETAKQNLLNNWQNTGEHPLDAAIRAQTDPDLRGQLSTAKEWVPPTLDELTQKGRDAIDKFYFVPGEELPDSKSVFDALVNAGIDIATVTGLNLAGKYVVGPLLRFAAQKALAIPEWLSNLAGRIPTKVLDLEAPAEAIEEIPTSRAAEIAKPAAREPAPTVVEGEPAKPAVETKPTTLAPENTRPFVPEASPAQKLQALSKEVIGPEEGGNTVAAAELAAKIKRIEDLHTENFGPETIGGSGTFFQRLAANEDKPTQELAAGYDAAASIRQAFRDLGKNEEGGLRLPIGPREEGVDFTNRLLRGYPAIGNLRAGVIAYKLEPFRKAINKFMPEWIAEMAKGPVGNPAQTTIGQMISWLEGQSLGVTLKQDHPLFPVGSQIREANQFVRAKIEDAVQRGIMSHEGFYEDYFRHLWKDPDAADKVFKPGVGVQGTSAGLMQRTIPTIEQGLARGLELRNPDPIETTVSDVLGKMRLAADAEIRNQLITSGFAQWGHEFQAPKPGWVALRGLRNTRDLRWVEDQNGTPVARGRREQLWAPQGVARLYNAWADTAFNPLGKFADTLAHAKNAYVGLKLIIPIYHAWTMAVETMAGGYGNALQELGHGLGHANLGELVRGLVDTLHTTAFPAKIATAYFKGKNVQHLALSGSNDPIIQMLTEGGARFGRRQEVYMPGRATDILTSYKRGKFLEDLPLTHPIRSTLHPFQTAGWAAMQVSSPLFDRAIPYLKTATNYERAATFLRQNPNIDPASELAMTRIRQIIDNTDDRMGELNQDNLFWPRWAKQMINASTISTGWVYGTIRSTANALGIRLAGRNTHLEWNPIATTNLAGLFVATAGINALYQYMKTGQAPQDVLDLAFPRTGGFGLTGMAARAFTPGTVKEYYDWAKVAMNTIAAGEDAGPGAAMVEFFQGADAYLQQKEWYNFIHTLMTGQDPLGHRIAYMPGGTWEWALKQVASPIALTNLQSRNPNSGISKLESVAGLREATKIVEDHGGWRRGMLGLHNKWTREELQRARKEAVQMGLPAPEGSATGGAGMGGYHEPAYHEPKASFTPHESRTAASSTGGGAWEALRAVNHSAARQRATQPRGEPTNAWEYLRHRRSRSR